MSLKMISRMQRKHVKRNNVIKIERPSVWRSFFYALKKIFELDALIDNTFKENSEKLGRKVLKQMN